jgi:hypothetical protein
MGGTDFRVRSPVGLDHVALTADRTVFFGASHRGINQLRPDAGLAPVPSPAVPDPVSVRTTFRCTVVNTVEPSA